MIIEAALHVNIDHVEGAVVADPDHVRAWLAAGGTPVEGAYGGFTYEVCSEHADPDECGDACDAPLAIYRAMITGADWE